MPTERDPAPSPTRRPPVHLHDLHPDPLVQLGLWCDEEAAGPMVLATLLPDGSPVVRTVPLRTLTPDGLVFHSDLRTAKAEQLLADARAGALLRWDRLVREVRAVGSVVRADDATSDAAYATSAATTKVRAWTHSPRGEADLTRTTLVRRRDEALALDPAERAARPRTWSAFVLVPHTVEVWQQSDDGIEDRVEYRRAAHRWEVRRLPP